jgi:hypothetical protein
MKRKIGIPILFFFALAGCAGEAGPSPAPIKPTLLEEPRTGSRSGDLIIRKYPGNYASFKLETLTGLTIVTDPYGMDEDVRADIVTISHHDEDHADLSRLLPEFDLLDQPGEYAIGGISILGVAGHHNKGDATASNVIFIFDFDGLRLAHFASQGEMPTQEMFAKIGSVNVLILQIYGEENGKLSVEEAGEIARRLQAKIVIPAHTDSSLTYDLTVRLGASSRRIPTGRLTVSKTDLEQQDAPEVVILDAP